MGDRAKPQEAMARVAMMNSAAPAFFAMLEGLLFEDVVLRVCKLIDKAESRTKMGPRRNLSLKAALLDQSARLGAPVAKKLESLIDAFVATSEPLITWRNWYISHEDYLVATGVEPLPPLSGLDVDQAAQKAVEIMELLDPVSETCEFGYDHMIGNGDGASLLYAMRCAQQYHKECLAIGVRPLSEAAKNRAAER